jgi:hypothetical protein
MDSLYFCTIYASMLVYIHDLKHFNVNGIIKCVDHWIKSTDRQEDYFVK